MTRSPKYLIRQAVRRTGWDIVHFRGGFEDLQISLMAAEGIDAVVDVGANEGQYSQRLRQLGYTGQIVAFEPLSKPFAKLEANFAGDPAFRAVRAALGTEDGETDINVSANTVSSSALPMLETHVAADQHSGYIGTERVKVARLDSQQIPGKRVWLKLDVQGFEPAVLDGATELLARTRVVQIELSLVPLYDGAPLIEQMVARLRGDGFVPVAIEPGFAHPATGEILQAEGLFRRA